MSQEQRKDWSVIQKISHQTNKSTASKPTPFPRLVEKVKQAIALCGGCRVTWEEVLAVIYVQTVGTSYFCSCSKLDSQERHKLDRLEIDWAKFAAQFSDGEGRTSRFHFNMELYSALVDGREAAPKFWQTLSREEKAAYCCGWGLALQPVRESASHESYKDWFTRLRRHQTHEQTQIHRLIVEMDLSAERHGKLDLLGLVDVFLTLEAGDPSWLAERALGQANGFKALSRK